MAIEVGCRQCGKTYRVADEFAGRSATCKACGAPMRVPKPAAVDEAGTYDLNALADMEDSAAVDRAVPMAGPPPMPPMPAPLNAGRPVTAFPRPGVRQKAPSRGRRLNFNRISIALLIGGVVLGFLGVQEMRLATAASATPHHLTCKELEEGGPGGNAHVTVEGFIVTPGGYIYEHKQSASTDDGWTRAWVPVVAKDGKYMQGIKKLAQSGELKIDALPRVENVTVLVKSEQIHNEGDVANLSRRGTVTGMVVNLVESLKAGERAKLQDAYPHTDFNRCWIIEEGREPASAGKYAGMMLGGAVLALAGLATLFPKA